MGFGDERLSFWSEIVCGEYLKNACIIQFVKSEILGDILFYFVVSIYPKWNVDNLFSCEDLVHWWCDYGEAYNYGEAYTAISKMVSI